MLGAAGILDHARDVHGARAGEDGVEGDASQGLGKGFNQDVEPLLDGHAARIEDAGAIERELESFL
ncbi:hypothetical protein D3C78_1622150 [compost metagenome]